MDGLLCPSMSSAIDHSSWDPINQGDVQVHFLVVNGRNGNQIWVGIFVKDWPVAQHFALAVDFLWKKDKILV